MYALLSACMVTVPGWRTLSSFHPVQPHTGRTRRPRFTHSPFDFLLYLRGIRPLRVSRSQQRHFDPKRVLRSIYKTLSHTALLARTNHTVPPANRLYHHLNPSTTSWWTRICQPIGSPEEKAAFSLDHVQVQLRSTTTHGCRNSKKKKKKKLKLKYSERYILIL